MDTKSLARVEIKDADKGLVTAVFSTFGVVDLDGDVVEKGAIVDGTPIVVSAYGHTSWDGQLPVGKGVVHTTDAEAVADMQFFIHTSHGKDAFETVKALSDANLQEWSYSLHNIKAEFGDVDGRSVRFIKSVDIKEVSPVLKGASINTRTLAAKAADRAGLKFSEHITAVLAEVDALATRAAEVVALRAEKGKTISDESAEQVAQVCASLERLKAAVVTPTPHQDADLLASMALRQVALAQGVTIQ